MTKKLLCLMLSLTLIMTAIFIPSTITVSAAENTAIYDGYFFTQDFEDIEANNWGVGRVVGNGKYEVKEEDNGNHYLEIGLQNDGTEAFQNANNEVAVPVGSNNWNLSFDVQKVSDGLPIGMEYYMDGRASAFALDSTNFENTEDWYRVAFTQDVSSVSVVVTNLTDGSTKRVHYDDINKPGSYWQLAPLSNMESTLRILIQRNDTTLGAIPEGYGVLDTCYRVDNVRVWNGNVIDEVLFEDESGDVLEGVPNGQVTAKAVVTSDSFVRWEATRTTELTTVLTAYDAEGTMIASSVETHNIESEDPVTNDAITERNATWAVTKTLEASIDLTDLDASRVELAVWDSEDGMRPIGRSYVLGEEDAVSASSTSEDFGESTGVTGRANNFTALDRATNANNITVAGKVDTNKETDIAVMARGNNSDNIVYAGQFRTTNNGSFKTVLGVDTGLMSGDTGIILILSGAAVNPEAMNITIGSQWDAFKSAFEEIEDGDSAEAFYSDYAPNLTYYNMGETEASSVDVSGLTDEDWDDLAFVKRARNYGELSYAKIITEAQDLVDALDLIEGFVESVNNAKNTGGTTEEKAAAILGALEADNAPANFSFGAASNKLAVCEMLTSLEDFETIQELYSEFCEATEEQADLETSALNDFKAIGSAQSAEEFFASENGTTLGITVGSLDFDETDWAFFWEGYADNDCDEVATSGEMNAAIAALRQYVTDVNAFLNNAETAAAAAAVKALFEADYGAESYFGKKMDEFGADGMNLDGIGNVDFFYAELLAALGEDNACADMAAIKTAYANARTEEIEFENLAVEALNGATSTDVASEFITNYAKLLKNEALTAYTERQKTIFAEINVKNETNVSDYDGAVAALALLAGKVTEAEAALDSMKEAAKSGDWETLLALVEGNPSSDTTVIEGYIGAFDTSAITDKRALYIRFAKGGNTIDADVNEYVDGTFRSITSLCDPFDTAYETQLDWEQNTGAYESTESELANFDENAWQFDVMANVVKISGKVDKNGTHRLVFVVTVDEVPIFYKQIETEGMGNFSTNLVLNPDTDKFPAYRAGEDVATIRIISDTVNSYKLPMLDLYSADVLMSIIGDFEAIADQGSDDAKADAMEEFVGTYGEILGIKEKVNKAIGDSSDANYDTNKTKVYHAMVFVYNKYSDSYEGLEDVTEVVSGKDGETGTDAIVQEMEKIVKLLDEMTEAANVEMNGTVGRWSLIRDLVDDAKENGWVTLNASTSGMTKSQIEDVYNEMTAKDYIKLSDIEGNYEDAVEAVKGEGSKNTPGSGGGRGGKESVMQIGGDYLLTGEKTELDPAKTPVAPFTDLADVAWAKTSIEGLRKYGIVRGDGNGKYRPNDEISREEFLTILFRLFSIEAESDSTVTFTDVDPDAWYAKTVAMAYETGIVKGYGDGRFGIGDNITRADMAIMILRMCEKQGVNLDPVEEAIVFNDYADIPEYAYYGIGVLQQANILNGDDKGNFNALQNVTRAESAVAFYGIFNMIKDFITYSWITTY